MRTRAFFHAWALTSFLWILGYLVEGALDHFGLAALFAGWLWAMISVIFEPFGEYTPYFAAAAAGFVLAAFLHWMTGRIDKYLARRVGVARPFIRAYEFAAPAGIGKPVGKEIRGGRASWTKHEHAAVIWIHRLSRIYQLPNDPKRGQVCYVQDGAPDDKRGYHNEDIVREKLRLAPDFNPPLGGVAFAWENDPESWSWIGQCLTRVELSGDGLVIQHFENGLMMGNIPHHNSTAVVWLVDNGRWALVVSD